VKTSLGGRVTARLAGAVAIAAFASCALTSADASAITTGGISGTVTAAVGGSAIEGVEVCAYKGLVERTGCVKTGAGGAYTLTGLASGEYTVEFTAGHEGALNYVTQYWHGKLSVTEAEPVKVTAPGTVSGVNAQLAAGGAIAGTVTAAVGAGAIEGANVCAYATSGEPAGCAKTGGGGAYTLIGLASGEYTVEFSTGHEGVLNYVTQYWHGKLSVTEAEPVKVTAPATVSGIDAQLAVGGGISGTVKAAAGAGALEGVEVCAWTASEEPAGCTPTSSTGAYTIIGLAAGEYRVQFIPAFESGYLGQYYNGRATLAEAEAVRVETGKAIPNIDASLAGGGQIAGTVTAASGGEAIEGVEVCALTSTGGNGCASTNSEGKYDITGLPAGEYTVGFSPNSTGGYLTQYYNDKPSFETAETVRVEAGQSVSSINAQLQQGGQITGTVTAASGGTPIEGVSVCAYHPAAGEQAGCATTGSGGTYTLAGLATGEYKVAFLPSGEGAYGSQYYNGKTTWAEAEPVSVTAGSPTPNIDASLAEAAHIAGIVTAASGGAPIEGIEACLFEASRQSTSVTCAVTNSKGEYTIGALAAGEYKMQFTAPEGSAYTSQYYNGAATFETAETISLTAGQTAGAVNASMAQGGQITGTVIAASNSAPLAGLRVCASDTATDIHIFCWETNAKGEYAISVPAGEYKIEFSSFEGSYLTQYYNDKRTLAEGESVTVTAGGTSPGIDAAMVEDGRITGKVINSHSAGIPGVEVCAYESATEVLSSCAPTGSTGEYEIGGLRPGEYKIQFAVVEGNYLGQYYKEQPSLAAATPVTVAAGTATPNIDATLAEGTSIAGKVTAKSNGAALSNANVCAIEAATGELRACVKSAASGEYTITGLLAGEYEIEFSGEGAYLTQYYNDKPSLAEAENVVVAVGHPATGIDAKLEQSGTISGTVTAASNGAPLKGVSVCASTGTRVPACTNTGEHGEYTILDLPQGSYTVKFAPTHESGYEQQYYNDKPTPESAETVTVTEGKTTAEINAKLSELGSISGVVTAASNGAPLEGDEVCARTLTGELAGCATTSATGEYTIHDLESGSYKVHFETLRREPVGYVAQYYNDKATLEEATPVLVEAEKTTPAIDAKLLETGGISGVVTAASNGAPIVGDQVCASDEAIGAFSCASTGASGEYTILDLEPGSYKVHFETQRGEPVGYIGQYYDDKATLEEATPVLVEAEKTTPAIDAKLLELGRVAGTVTNTKNEPVAGANVLLLSAEFGGVEQSVITGEHGEYTIPNVEPGSYKVEFSAGQTCTVSGCTSQPYVSQFWQDKATLNEAEPITVTAEHATEGINAKLIEGGSITGKVVNTAGEPAGGVTVQVLDATTGAGVASGSTNETGDYNVVGLPTGSYRVEFSNSIYVTQFYNDKATFAEAEAIAVEVEHAVEGINATMHKPGAISGRVINAKGEPVIGAEVGVFGESGGSWFVVAFGGTSETGEYTISNLTPGKYKVGFFPPSCVPGACYVPQYYKNKPTLAEAETVTTEVDKTTEHVDATLNEGGSIAGKVTNGKGEPLAGVQVSVLEGTGSSPATVASATTEATGEYTITQLPAGSYRLSFASGPCPGPSCYTTQYYNGKRTLEEATTVEVQPEHTVERINASMVPPETSPPVNTTPPTITGEARQGQKLTEVNGTWTNAPISYSYRWLRCSGATCSAIATGQTYTLTSEDVGHTIKVEEEAFNEVGPGSPATSVTTSTVLPVAPTNTAAPKISGEAREGQSLTATEGGWEPASSVSTLAYSYRWERCDGTGNSCSTISSAITTMYKLTSEDVGHTIKVEVTASNAGGSGSPAASTATSSVLPRAPINTAPVAIAGEAREGQTLKATEGGWEPPSSVSTITYTYHWLRCDSTGSNCSAITGATNQTYTLTPTDVGHTIRVETVATNAGGSSSPLQSAQTSSVLPRAPINTAAPTVTGEAREGQQLTEHNGNWEPSGSAINSTYEWLRCDSTGSNCSAITGATGQTYTLTGDDVGHTIKTQETATNAGGTGSPAASAATNVVVPIAPGSTTPPTITGEPRQGQTLTEGHGTWTSAPTGYTYQWMRCDASGNNCSSITGETGQTYTLTENDVAHTVKVEETGTNAGGTGNATSSATAVVAASTIQKGPTEPPTETAGPHVNPTTGAITFTYDISEPGQLTADSVIKQGASIARVASSKAKAKKCKAGYIRKKTKCVNNGPVTYGTAELVVTTPGVYKITVKPTSKALAALRRGTALVVTTTIYFMPTGATTPITKTLTTRVKLRKGGKHGHGKNKHG